ncbi:L10-interacting MYB domain-containing protein [Cardamine amara subsp. amara]|uniref:L10-interacting MYB domain-containing protein n=1 Tax=Cardamine amara subsp. amara TaxID=228776 RepID=A0ABD1A047_CARAN
MRKRWTPSHDKVLADLVVKQVQSGKRHNNVFDRKTWDNIRDEFNKQTELNFNNNQLRKHLDVLRQRYNTLKSPRVQNEFVIEDTRCILGFDLWEDFGVQPRSEPVKVKDCPIYEQLCTIFADDSVDGRYAQSSHFEGLDESKANQSSDLLTTPTEGTITSENIATPNVAQANTNSVKRKSALSDMVTSLRSRMADSKTQEDRFSITNCINALDEIENLDEGVYFAALDLFENPAIRETFLSLKGNKLRLKWLQGKCRKLLTSVAQLG